MRIQPVAYSPPRRFRNRSGIALAVALAVLVVVATLIAGAVFFTNQNFKMANNSRRLAQSFGVAEAGTVEVIRSWNPTQYTARGLFPLDSFTIAQAATAAGSGAYGGKIYRLSQSMYLIDVTGADSVSLRMGAAGGARQRVGLLVRIAPLLVNIQGALTVGGPVQFGGGNVFIDGNDHVPPGWGTFGGPTCPDIAAPELAGVRAKAAGDVQASQGQIVGSPNTLITPSMDSTTFLSYGNSNYAALVQSATFNIAPGQYSPNPSATNGVCNLINTNWGDSVTTNPCGWFYPIVHFTGDVTLSNGQGQGILLVDGTLTFSGTFRFRGLIITQGGFKTLSGGSPKVFGAVLSREINLATTAFQGDAIIDYSSCAISRAMSGTSLASMVRSRSWVRLQ